MSGKGRYWARRALQGQAGTWAGVDVYLLHVAKGLRGGRLVGDRLRTTAPLRNRHRVDLELKFLDGLRLLLLHLRHLQDTLQRRRRWQRWGIAGGLEPLVGPEPADASSAATSSKGCAPCRGVPGVLPGQAAAGLLLRLCARSPGDAGLDRTGSRNLTCTFAGAREGRRWSGSFMATADFDGGLAAGLCKIAQHGIAQRRREDPGW